ncbi:hypothetical protein SELMODRAFT_418203 [Selaginella moellendorffii]|uniref:Uncharacterized protein n=1 Tax=Selaginella moellendorffii TaxID=88036 RepID=D8S502_SELML|nr:hypothetical protein SELMODRAFT_418203 [Selaginella moellendorffii]
MRLHGTIHGTHQRCSLTPKSPPAIVRHPDKMPTNKEEAGQVRGLWTLRFSNCLVLRTICTYKPAKQAATSVSVQYSSFAIVKLKWCKGNMVGRSHSFLGISATHDASCRKPQAVRKHSATTMILSPERKGNAWQKRRREPDEEGEQEEKKRLKRGEIALVKIRLQRALTEIAILNYKLWEAPEDAELKEQIASEKMRASQLQEDESKLERELLEILQPPPEYLKRVEGIAESAFAQEYQRVGGLDNVESLREKLEETGDMWKTEKTMIAPVVTLVQSSGWGKSRTTCELANVGVFVIYCSFASSGTAYPPRSAFADFFYTNAIKLLSSGPPLLSQSRFMLFCIDYFVSCIEALLQLTSGEDPMDAKKFLNDLMVGENFWGLVQAKMEIGNQAREEFANRLDVDLKEKPGEKTNIWGIWESKVFKKYNTLEGLLSNVPAPAKGKLKVLFAMDEARWFTSHADPTTVAAFVPARRASRVLPENGSVSVMFTGRLNNFAPPNKASGLGFSSDRVAAAGKLVAHPAYCFFLADLPSDEQTGGLLLAQVEDLGRLCGYGRPLWQALVKASASAGDVLLLAVDKLLGGTGSFNKFLFEGGGLSHEACLATLGCRVCIDINPHATIITDMVASHLLSVMSISDDHTLVWTHWATEPLVAAAAAQVLRSGTGWKECLEALVTGMKRGWVDRGYRGELVARVLLLLAVDSLGRNSWKCFTFDELCHGLSGKSLSDLIREDEQNSASSTPKAPGGGEEAQVEVNMPPPPASALKRSTRRSRVKVNKKLQGQPQVASASLSKVPGEKAQVKVNTPPPEVKSPSPTLTALKAPSGSTHIAEGEGETKQADGSGKEEIHRNMGEAKFFCLLFRKADFRLQDLTAKDLLEFGKAGMGIICRENEWGIDIVIVGFFGDTFSLETMTLILVQMLSSSAGPQGWTGLKVPYASLVLNVAHVPSSSVRYRTRKLVREALLKKTPANQSMAMALHDAHPECKGLQGWRKGYDADRSHPVFKLWERYFASDDRLQHIVVIQGLDAFSSKDKVKDLVDISLDSTADMRKLERVQKTYAHRMFGWVKNTEMCKCLEPKLTVKKQVSDGLCYNSKTNNDN